MKLDLEMSNIGKAEVSKTLVSYFVNAMAIPARNTPARLHPNGGRTKSSVRTSAEIPRQFAIRDPNILDQTWRIPASPDKPRNAIRDHSGHGRDVSVPQCVQRI